MMNSKPRNLSQALEELEKLAEHAGSDLKNKLHDEMENLQEKFEEWKPQIDELKAKAQDQAKKAKDTVEEHLHKSPWQTLGLVGLIFFIFGFLFAYKSGRRD